MVFSQSEFFISQSEIFSKVSDLEIYEHYLNAKVKLGRVVCSPLREDRHPSFSFYRGSSNAVLWKDYANGDSGNAIKFVALMFSISIEDAKVKIFEELINRKPKLNKHSNLVNLSTDKDNEFDSRGFKVSFVDNFTERDLKFWESYGVPEYQLRKYKIRKINYIVSKRTNITVYKNKDYNPCYGWVTLKFWKFYLPFEEKGKRFFGSHPSDALYGFTELPEEGDLLIITKSMKDVMFLNMIGYNVVAPGSESIVIGEDILKKLKERFSRIAIMFDNDTAGQFHSKKLAEHYSLELLNFTLSKDPTDAFFNGINLETIKEHIECLLNRYP